MVGTVKKHARDIGSRDVQRLIRFVSTEGRNRRRNLAIVMLSFYAGLRAGEIVQLRWRMLLDADGEIGSTLRLENIAAKKLSGRVVPLRADVRAAVISYSVGDPLHRDNFVFSSERGCRLKAQSVINWFRGIYSAMGLTGASSHSGRRYFITMAARKIFEAGGSLRDVQELAGHRAVTTTQLYIARSPDAQCRVVDLI